MQLPQLTKPQLLLVLLVFLLNLINAYLFIIVVGGAKNDLQFVESQLEQEEKLLATIQERLANDQGSIKTNTLALQKKLPSKAIVDQFLLNLEMAETVSKGQMLNLSFTKGGLGDVNAPIVEQSETDEVGTGGLPEGINRLSVNLSFSAPSYERLQDFLTTMESLERITKVDQISFSGNQEGSDFGGNELNVNLTVSTFYAEGLNELLNDLPWVEYPEPSNKKNPLYTGQ